MSKLNIYRNDSTDYNLDIICPYCTNKGISKVMSNEVFKNNDVYDQTSYFITQCPDRNCKGVTLVIYDRLNNGVIKTLPYPKSDKDSFNKNIPEDIRADFAEAFTCAWTGCLKSSVIMCRRVLQFIIRDKGIKERDLEAEIKKLYEQGFISKNLFDAATEVRYFGNYAAHPKNDILNEIKPKETMIILKLVQDILDNVYVHKQHIEELKKIRTPNKSRKN